MLLAPVSVFAADVLCSVHLRSVADLTILCQDTRWTGVARHLVSSLRLPQLRIVQESAFDRICSGPVLLAGDSSWFPRMPPESRVWRFQRLSRQAAQADAINRPASCSTRYFAPVGAVSNSMHQQLFWSLERLKKREATLSIGEGLDWLLWLLLVDLSSDREDRLLQLIASELALKGPSQDFRECFLALSAERPDAIRARVEDCLSSQVAATWKGYSDEPFGLKPPTRKALLQVPGLCVALSLQVSRQDRAPLSLETCRELFRDVLLHSHTAVRIFAVNIAARQLKLYDLVDESYRALDAAHLRVSGTSLLRTHGEATGFVYSPLQTLVAGSQSSDPASKFCEGIGQVAVEQHRLASFDRPLIDTASKSVERQLVDDWLHLHGAPSRAESCYRLGDGSYEQLVAALEQSWLKVFGLLLLSERKPLYRVCPLPEGKSSSFSLRYDVDRPVSEEQIRAITDQQMRIYGTRFGSWFYFANSPDRRSQAPLLEACDQEVGLHVVRASEALPGYGVTHHSSALSDYWRGEASLSELAAKRAVYGEYLAQQTPTPRPFLLESDFGPESLWLTSVSFPLEGSTADTSLAYFDRLAAQFEEQLAGGGHAIVGTHPDLKQGLLDELAGRYELTSCWFASVGDVVERYRSVCCGTGEILVECLGPVEVSIRWRKGGAPFGLERIANGSRHSRAFVRRRAPDGEISLRMEA